MRTFLSFLAEGGGIHAGEVKTTPWSTKDRAGLRSDLHGILKSVEKEHGVQIEKNASDRATGSTHHIFDGRISDEDIRKHLPAIGDADFQVHSDDVQRLRGALKVGHKHHGHEIMAVKAHGTQVSIIVRHPKTGAHHQIDFSGSANPGNPETRFQQSSHWPDRARGIKGAHTAFLRHGAGKHLGNSVKTTDTAKEVSRKLFGTEEHADKLDSFEGVAKLLHGTHGRETFEKIADGWRQTMEKSRHTVPDAAEKILRRLSNA